ncbi:hypothetical protein GGS21DRAFT_505772 [Xylaria nigripes]|nr:hypothetical protein GGS21DRAFT_505772 [Xylaria nigripes]
MSVRIALDQPPEFYTNLDFISGRVILILRRPEVIGNIIVKLEGESRTALSIYPDERRDYNGPPSLIDENHKVLYKIFQVFSDDSVALSFQPGTHEFKFRFKVPLNNICHDGRAISATMGIGGIGGLGNSGILGLGGFRTMDGAKQLMLSHVKSTLPPSLTGFPHEAEIRYYVKVTVQRPGVFKDNWRSEVGFKFLPIEPPRPSSSPQEAFARRPFTFKPRTPMTPRRSFFGSSKSANVPIDTDKHTLPVVEMSARLPFPSILTCNEPVPIRLIAKKLAPSLEQIRLTALEIALIGYTHVRVAQSQKVEQTRWIVVSAPKISVSLGSPADPENTEFEIPPMLWATQRLPNTVAPSFRACNLARRYELELKLSLSWGHQGDGSNMLPQVISLPLTMSRVAVFSGIRPPPQLLQTANQGTLESTLPYSTVAGTTYHVNGHDATAPPFPPRPGMNGGPSIPPRPSDPLYPPQLGPDNVPMHDDAPPSYDEAIAESLTGPLNRPAYSGVTAENAPSTISPEKFGQH